MRIVELILETRRISEQKEFYSEVLGLNLISSEKTRISFKIGKSILTLIENTSATPYHFAINIPSNQINESTAWLKERVEIQKDGENEIVDFPAWNSESVYFYDTEANILEFIARKNLENKSNETFSESSFLEISEIGLATSQFEEKYESLTSNIGLPKFGGSQEIFSALGSETGLIILIDKNKKDWFPTNDKAFASNFILKMEIENKRLSLEYKNEELKLIDT